MSIRGFAVIFGLIAGLGTFIAAKLSWTESVVALHIDPASIAGSVDNPIVKLAWAVCGGVAVFSVATLLVALIGGIAETTKTRTRIEALRRDPDLADRWNAADWRAAFAHTAIADQAEAMIAIVPVESQESRRVVVDTALLLALNRIWLDRMTLNWTISPLPAILLGLAAAAALFVHDAGGKWEAALAAGMVGWFVIRLAQYAVRGALAPLTDAAIGSATAAIRPLSSVAMTASPANAPAPQTPAPPASQPAAGAHKRIEQEEAEIIAAALSNVIWEPLGRLADAAEKLQSAARPPSRDKEIESALAEIRAGIEELLANSGRE